MNRIVLDNFVLTSELFPRFTLQRADRFCTTKPSPITVGVGDMDTAQHSRTQMLDSSHHPCDINSFHWN